MSEEKPYFDPIRARSSIEALQALAGNHPEASVNVTALQEEVGAAEEEIAQLVRGLREAVEPPTFMGEPAYDWSRSDALLTECSETVAKFDAASTKWKGNKCRRCHRPLAEHDPQLRCVQGLDKAQREKLIEDAITKATGAHRVLNAYDYEDVFACCEAVLAAAVIQNTAANGELGYATRLAEAVWSKHYRQDAPQWKPLPDLMGVLTQIDNMTSGLTRNTAVDERMAAQNSESVDGYVQGAGGVRADGLPSNDAARHAQVFLQSVAGPAGDFHPAADVVLLADAVEKLRAACGVKEGS